MKIYIIILQEEAIQDMQDAYDWYEEQLLNLGEEFLEEVYKIFEKIKRNPQHFGIAFNEFRNVRLKRFPYLIIYKIESNKVYINSIRHIRRKPKF